MGRINWLQSRTFLHDSDPRPTFLFWARDVGAVALLRGANRPLLTRLVESEVRIETKQEPRDRQLQIDFRHVPAFDEGLHCI